MGDEIYWDPFDAEIDEDPYPVWKRMRDDAPVYRNDKYDFWALSRNADIEAAHRDPQTYSSGHGTVLELMGPEGLSGARTSIIFMDPPDHDLLRALVSRAFTPRRVGALEGHIREICAELLDPYVGSSGFDYVREFTQQLPSRVISELIGVDPDKREEIRRWIDQTFHIDPEKGMINDVSFEAQIALWQHWIEHLEDRARSPRDDMITALLTAEVDDPNGGKRKLTQDEAAGFINLLVSAGTETVARLLGWACDLLEKHPDQRAALAADPGLTANAVEETLRYEPPSPVQGRWQTKEVTLHGVTIPKDSRVLLLTGSAGRDERVYPDADTYDIRRDVGMHVSLGLGIHFCLGASLARMEGRIGIEETLKRFPEWEVDRANAVQQHTSTVRGYESLPIKV